jgi:O-acetylserine/cysteine efflux transporter
VPESPAPHARAAALSGTAAPGRSGLIALFASVLFLSSAWPLTKLAIGLGASPLWFAESRAVLSGAVAAVVLAFRGRLRAPVLADLPALLAVGALQIGAFFAFAHLAVAWVAAGRTAVLANTTTIWVVPLSVLVLGERIPPRQWLAAALGLAGVGVLTGPWAIDWRSATALIGNGFLLAAGFCWSLAIIVIRAAPPRSSMFVLLPWCFLLASVLLLPLVIGEAARPALGASPGAWVAIAYVGLIAGPLGTWGVMEATLRLPPIVSSVGFLTTPAAGLVLANLVLGEPFTADLLTGAGLILGGVALAALAGRAR